MKVGVINTTTFLALNPNHNPKVISLLG